MSKTLSLALWALIVAASGVMIYFAAIGVTAVYSREPLRDLTSCVQVPPLPEPCPARSGPCLSAW